MSDSCQVLKVNDLKINGLIKIILIKNYKELWSVKERREWKIKK